MPFVSSRHNYRWRGKYTRVKSMVVNFEPALGVLVAARKQRLRCPVATAGRVMRSRGKLAQVSTGLGNLALFGTRSRRAGLPFFELLLVLDPF